MIAGQYFSGHKNISGTKSYEHEMILFTSKYDYADEWNENETQREK